LLPRAFWYDTARVLIITGQKILFRPIFFFDYTTALWEKLQYAVPRFIGRADDSGQLWVSLLDSRNFDARLIALTARLEQLMKKK